MKHKISSQPRKPDILAPAGNRTAFLAALSAGADAVYCGLKHFSARMTAENFTLPELARLVELAHEQGTRVYVTLNTLLKPDELSRAAGLLSALTRTVQPDALIIQDPGLLDLARQSGFGGEIHLSTLSAVTMGKALPGLSRYLTVDRVVLPRELDVDEIKQVAAQCPPSLKLEVFVQGALCYAVSGRCYWSSYLGGKSGLRGRCVQPCRRRYTTADQSGRLFSCLDFSLDVLVKPLLEIPEIVAWKIEGRKKGPHYVYYTTTAYKILRDHSQDPRLKKTALGYLEAALGRPTTHYHFLPQRPFPAANTGDQTGSGLLVGRVKGSGANTAVMPRMNLFAGDLLRIGYEDQPGHQLCPAPKYIPARGRLHLRLSGGKSPAKGTPVFLVDRLESALKEKIKAWAVRLESRPLPSVSTAAKSVAYPRGGSGTAMIGDMWVGRSPRDHPRTRGERGLWLSLERGQAVVGGKSANRVWWWLPPVIWPSEEDQWAALLSRLLENGARRFVLNAPWQRCFFPLRKNLQLWAGPFCNLTNPLAVKVCQDLGFTGAVVSPELSGDDYIRLSSHSPLPLGLVISGNWPLGLARILPAGVSDGCVFTSPRQEKAWIVQHDATCWLYPNWPLDLRSRKKDLEKAGYRLFVHLTEPLPAAVKLKNRPGQWNWQIGLG